METIIPWLPLVVASVALSGVIITPFINAGLAKRNARSTAEAIAEVAAVIKTTSEKHDAKLEEIRKLADGRLTAALEKIDQLEERAFMTEGTIPTGEPPAKSTGS